MSVVTQWQALSGYFWIYYNTRKNLRKSKPEEWEFMQERPWVVKQFPNIERVMSMRPEAQRREAQRAHQRNPSMPVAVVPFAVE